MGMGMGGCRKGDMLLCGEKIISDGLLMATMSIVGFPVHVHLIDNSLFSAIFFTASFHYNNNYSGIVLKNAKMIKKGKSAANVESGSVIETLVVRFADLLQVVAKGNALPEDAVSCNIAGDPFKIVVDRQNEEAPSPRGNERQGEGDKPLREMVNCEKMSEICKKEIKHVQGSLPAVDSRIAQSKSVEKVVSDSPCKLPPKGDASDHPLFSSDKLDEQCQSRCSSQNSARSDGVPSRSSTPRSSTETDHKESPTSKVSKLNPGAKLFCPSVTKPPTPPPVVPTVANVAYVPDNYSMGPIASHQQEVDMNPFISLSAPPTKFIPYANLVAGTGFTDPQYSQSFNGSMGAGTQAVRYGGQQVHPTYAVPACVSSNDQHVMVGQGGQQLIYLHPVSYDVNQATAAFSQVSLQPSQTPPVAQFLKHQGNVATQTLQLYVNPPFMPVGQQQIAVQGHPYLSPPPFPVIPPTPTQGATTGFFTPKFT